MVTSYCKTQRPGGTKTRTGLIDLQWTEQLLPGLNVGPSWINHSIDRVVLGVIDSRVSESSVTAPVTWMTSRKLTSAPRVDAFLFLTPPTDTVQLTHWIIMVRRATMKGSLKIMMLGPAYGDHTLPSSPLLAALVRVLISPPTLRINPVGWS